MKRAVDEVQQCIKTCNSSSNISMVVTENISKYVQYINELDPTDIAFDKVNFFNNIKIKGYWQKLADYYPLLENLLHKLSENERVLSNTQNTLSIKCKRFETEMEKFRALSNEQGNDTDYMQQAIVVENTYTLLLNTIKEYETLEKKVGNILSISKQVFETALLIAQGTYKIKVNNTSTLSGVADIAIYKNNYASLQRVLV